MYAILKNKNKKHFFMYEEARWTFIIKKIYTINI